MVRWGGEIAPANIGEAVTPHNATNFTLGVCEGIYVGSTGNVSVVFADDTAITFTGVPAGVILPVRAKRVNSTNTTASAMVALYTRT
jgi:hypothetical protein